MSITFYVDGWDEQPKNLVKIYGTDEYPDLDEEDFVNSIGYEEDSNGRWFETRTVFQDAFPELNFSNENTKILLESIGYVYYSEGAFPSNQLSNVISECMRLINSPKKLSIHERHAIQEGNFFYRGIDAGSIKVRASKLMDLLSFAKQKNKLVYWG